MDLKIIKRVDYAKIYKDKQGKEHPSVNYYVVLPNKRWIAIRPSFYQDTKVLDAIAETVVNKGIDENEQPK